jgi:hypothetical protein
MDLEQLTKHQIILLTLLVSFVTSIATGIVTVSLMQQAPAGVTKVVNQIVEHTVEKIVPQTQGASPGSVTEHTVVVKDDDLTAQSIATVQKGIIRITAKGSDALIARGLLTDASGTAVTDAAALKASGATEFEAILPDGSRVPFTLATSTPTATTTPLAWGVVAVGTSTAFAPVKFADPSKLSLGQSVVRIGGVGNDTVGEGVIASFPAATSGTPQVLESSVSAATPGSVLITIFGEVIGITTGVSSQLGADFYTIPALPSTADQKTPSVINAAAQS